MDKKQLLVLMAGVAGILLVVLCPRWFLPPTSIDAQERSIGYRFITQPPKPPGVVKEENGHKYSYSNQVVATRIDRADLSVRIGLIIAVTASGLWILQARKRLHYSKTPQR